MAEMESGAIKGIQGRMETCHENRVGICLNLTTSQIVLQAVADLGEWPRLSQQAQQCRFFRDLKKVTWSA